MSATADLLALLQRHYIKPGAPLPGGVFLPEVGWNPAGGESGRAGGCDAIYVGFTSSSGRILVGHELKVTRADWLNELSKPGKADAWADQCHEWWLVVGSPAIVRDGELPAGWGLMSPGRSRTRMTVHVPAERKPAAHTPSWLAVRSIMARQDTLRAAAIAKAQQAARNEATAEVSARVEQRIATELARAEADGRILDGALDKLRAVEKVLGRSIKWEGQPGYLGQPTIADLEQIRDVLAQTNSVKAAVRKLTGVGHRYNLDELQKALDAMRNAVADLGDQAAV